MKNPIEVEIAGILNGENIELAGQSIFMETIVNDKPVKLSDYLLNEGNFLLPGFAFVNIRIILRVSSNCLINLFTS